MVLASLIGIEVTLRAIDARAGRTSEFWAPAIQPSRLFRPHPFLAYELTPGFAREGMYEIHVNSLSMRGPELAPAKAPGTIRILVGGGSTTFSTGVRRDEQAWPALLRVELERCSPVAAKFEVGNCGVSGWTSAETLIDLLLRRAELAPDYFIFYGAANDARFAQAPDFLPDYTHLRSAWVEERSAGFDAFLLRHWRTWAWATRGLDPAGYAGILDDHMLKPDWETRHVRSDVAVGEAGVATFLRNVESMVVVCRARGIQPVLCTFAMCRSLVPTDGERYVETIDAMNVGLRAMAARLDVDLMDVAAALDDRPELHADWMHHDLQGCRALAEFLAAEARRQGTLGL